MPVISVGAWALDPMNGVTVYVVTDPPVAGAVQVSPAEVYPPVATTLVGVPGAAWGVNTTSTQ